MDLESDAVTNRATHPHVVLFCPRDVDFGELLSPEMRAQHKHTTYDLAANIVHDREPGGGQGGTYRCHVLHKVSIGDQLFTSAQSTTKVTSG